MTAAADRPHRLLDVACFLAVAVGALTACALTACTPAPPIVAAPEPSAAELTIRAAIDGLNATAGGEVADQQEALRRTVDPALLAELDRCPPAQTTLRFEPVYAGLRPDPDWRGPSGTPAGTVYALPTLIRIYTGDRITGTDLGTLFLGIEDGRALLAPVCVA